MRIPQRQADLDSIEVDLASRTVMEYLLSPVQKTAFEAGRER